MKPLPSPRPARRAGSVLVVTLLISMIIGITLAAFMDLSSAQHRAVIRSGVWNACIPIAESGLEEALTHTFVNSANLASQGWTLSTTGLTMSNGVSLTGTLHHKSRTLNGGNFIAAIQGGAAPTLTVQGNLPKPLSTTDMISRTIEVRTVGAALFARGLVARSTINFNGIGISFDSFDSQNPLLSTNGRYDVAKKNDNGSVGSVEGDVLVGGGDIYGIAGTGPGGNISMGSGGAVGSETYIDGGSTGIEPGHSQNDLNLAFPDAVVPFTSGYTTPSGGNVINVDSVTTNSTASNSLAYPSSPPGPVTTNYPTSTTYPTGTTYPVYTNIVATAGKGKSGTTFTTNYTYTLFIWTATTYSTNYSTNYFEHILDTGDYYLSGVHNANVLVRGNARLWVDGSVSESGGRAFTVSNTGTLQMWVRDSASFSGNAAVNTTYDALRMSIFGLPTCTSISFTGNGEFTGTIYAPSAHLTYSGGGSDRSDFMGAAIVGSAQLNGHFEFHYDENLGRNGPLSGFVIDSWLEI